MGPGEWTAIALVAVPLGGELLREFVAWLRNN